MVYETPPAPVKLKPHISPCRAPIVSFPGRPSIPRTPRLLSRASFSFNLTWFQQSTAARSRVYQINIAHQSLGHRRVYCAFGETRLSHHIIVRPPYSILSRCHRISGLGCNHPPSRSWKESSSTPSAHQLAARFPQSYPPLLHPLTASGSLFCHVYHFLFVTAASCASLILFASLGCSLLLQPSYCLLLLQTWSE